MDEKINQLLDALAERVGQQQKAYKHDLPAGFTLSTNYMHGPTGIFGAAGISRDVFSTRVTPRGIMSALPAYGTTDTNPLQAYLTGFTDETGSEADAVCDEPPEAGEMKSCLQGAMFGRIMRKTEPLEVNTIGRTVNRGEFRDLALVNDPLLNSDALWTPGSVPKSFQDVLNREVLAKWLALGVAFENKLGKLVWEGNPANSSANNGYIEYDGFERLVKTGHVDVINGTHCPSLDSDIKDFQYKSVEANAFSLYFTLQMLYRFVKHNAETMNFGNVQWAWVMQDALFRMLTDYWPCVYATSRCGGSGDTPANAVSSNADAMAMKAMSDEMYNGRYLLVDGIRIPVILDDMIPYESNINKAGLAPGEFASDIYLLPLTVRGGRIVTFMEYFDYSAANGVMQGIMDGRLTNEFWTDGGKWLWTFSRTNWCVSWIAKIEPRLRLLTPHLAGRLMNVKYSPMQMFRMPHPDDSYFVNGGNIVRSNAPYNLRS